MAPRSGRQEAVEQASAIVAAESGSRPSVSPRACSAQSGRTVGPTEAEDVRDPVDLGPDTGGDAWGLGVRERERGGGAHGHSAEPADR